MKVRTALFSLLVIICTSCSVMCNRKSALPGTKWTNVQKEFVADAGTMTITHTLEFTSRKDVRLEYEYLMPAHPAMYMNENGTVDTIPASSSENVIKGSYSVHRNKLTICWEDGSQKEFELKDGAIVGEVYTGHTLVFTRDGGTKE